jgi:hypothetical protein
MSGRDGKPHSAETRAKMSAVAKARYRKLGRERKLREWKPPRVPHKAAVYVPRKREDSGGWVPNAPIRKAVQKAVREGDTYGSIAQRIGWTRRSHRGKTVGDGTRLKRRVGLARETKTNSLTRTLRYDIAVRIIRAIGEDPVDYDL